MIKLKWINKYSHEEGFVGTIRESKGYFENADKENARKFRSVKEAEKAIEILKNLGEADNNDFETIED